MKYGEGSVRGTLTFTINVEKDELDGGFVVECMELPGCVSEGETMEEAMSNILDAITAVLETRMAEQLEQPAFEFSTTRVVTITTA